MLCESSETSTLTEELMISFLESTSYTSYSVMSMNDKFSSFMYSP